jgi:hypothetical protein
MSKPERDQQEPMLPGFASVFLWVISRGRIPKTRVPGAFGKRSVMHHRAAPDAQEGSATQ